MYVSAPVRAGDTLTPLTCFRGMEANFTCGDPSLKTIWYINSVQTGY